jgi:hypothetical protein
MVMKGQRLSRRVGEAPSSPNFLSNLVMSVGWVGRQAGEWRGAGGQPADGRSGLGNREALGGAPIVNPHAGSVRHSDYGHTHYKFGDMGGRGGGPRF